MQSGENGSSRANPFAPISYEERLSKPAPRAASAAGELPMRPGQPYIASYDKWLKKPAPLSPLRPYGEASEEYGSQGSKQGNAYSGMVGAGYGAAPFFGEQSCQQEHYARQMQGAAEAHGSSEAHCASESQSVSGTDENFGAGYVAEYGAAPFFGEQSCQQEHYARQMQGVTEAQSTFAESESSNANAEQALSADIKRRRRRADRHASENFSAQEESLHSEHFSAANNTSGGFVDVRHNSITAQENEALASKMFSHADDSSHSASSGNAASESRAAAQTGMREPSRQDGDESFASIDGGQGESFPFPPDAETANSAPNEPFTFARHAQQEPILWHDVSSDSGSGYQEESSFPFPSDTETAGSAPDISFPFPPIYSSEPVLWHDITPFAESDPTEDAAEQPAAPVSASDSPQQGSDQIAAFFDGGSISSDLPPLPSVRPNEASASEAPTPQPHKLSPEQIKQNLAQFKPPSIRRKDYEKPKKPPVRPWRVISIIAVAGMLVFVCIVGGKFLLNLSRDKQEMDNFRNEYREMYGIDPENDSMLVTLPPEGSTFAPPSAGATYAPRTSEAQAAHPSDGHDGDELIGSTDSTRTRLAVYPDNPLQNITDSVKAARAQNADIVGRLVIPNVLDEQIVQRNNTFYLTHSFRGSASDAGAVFADESCSFKTPPENVLLRGRDAIEGKSFAPLWQYGTGGEAFAFSAASATLTTPYEENEFVLFAVIVTPSSGANAFNYAGHPSFSADTEMLEYVESARRRSLYRFNVSIDASDRLLTLATVGSGDQTMVLLFRMKRPNER